MQVAKPDYSEAKIVLAMVGLPARGKSYLSNKLMRYLKVRLSPCHPILFTLPSGWSTTYRSAALILRPIQYLPSFRSLMLGSFAAHARTTKPSST
jgi:hypothetical protein